MTGRELAEKLLALPNPDLPVEIKDWMDGNWVHPTDVNEAEATIIPDEDWSPISEEEKTRRIQMLPSYLSEVSRHWAIKNINESVYVKEDAPARRVIQIY